MNRDLYAIALVVMLASGAAWGQDYPVKPVRIVTAPAGGGSDFTSRLIAQGLSVSLGRQVIVDNRPTSLIAEIVARSPPDGYTLLVAGPNFWTGPLLRKMSYDPLSDFVPVTWAVSSPNILVVHPSLPVKSVRELIALAKARPGQLNYAFSTPGSSNHFAAELFKSMAAVNMVGIPYKGAGPATAALISGEVQLTIGSVTSTEVQVRAGRLRALAVTTKGPSALAPGLPTVSASGLPGYEAITINGVYAPARTPAIIVERLHNEIVKWLRNNDAREKLLSAGLEVIGTSPQETITAVKSEMAIAAKLIAVAGIREE